MSDDDMSGGWGPIAGAALTFLLAAGAILVFLGPSWPALILTVVIALGISALRQAGLQETWREERDPDRGELVCPSCGSVQTERVERFDDQGRTYVQPHCFACDTDFDAADADTEPEP